MSDNKYAPKVGEAVQAFHPRMFGVVKTGTVAGIGPKYVRIDFGSLLGGTLKVPRSHVVGPS